MAWCGRATVADGRARVELGHDAIAEVQSLNFPNVPFLNFEVAWAK